MCCDHFCQQWRAAVTVTSQLSVVSVCSVLRGSELLWRGFLLLHTLHPSGEPQTTYLGGRCNNYASVLWLWMECKYWESAAMFFLLPSCCATFFPHWLDTVFLLLIPLTLTCFSSSFLLPLPPPPTAAANYHDMHFFFSLSPLSVLFLSRACGTEFYVAWVIIVGWSAIMPPEWVIVLSTPYLLSSYG